MNTYRNSAIVIIDEWIKEMQRCQEHSDSVANDVIFIRHQAQTSILLGLIETVEGIRPDSYSDDLDNMVIRINTIKELFNV